MSGFYKPTDQSGQPLNTIYAEDIGQIIDVLTGQRDGGALSLLGQLATPASAPSITTSAGSLTGTYKWQVYWVSGIMDGTAAAHIVGRTPAGPATTGTALSSQRATLDITGLTPPTGVIGWGVARTQAGGSTFLLVPGSEQFRSAAGSLPATFVDNTADGSLVTAVQTVNTTGTTFVGANTIVSVTTAKDVSNTTAETDLLSGLVSVLAGGMGTTRRLIISIIGDYLNNTGSNQTFTLKIKLGGTTIFAGSSTSIASASGRRAMKIEFEIANLGSASLQFTVGSVRIGSAQVPTTGIGYLDAAAANAIDGEIGGSSSIDTSVANALAVTVAHSAASANLSCRLQAARVAIA